MVKIKIKKTMNLPQLIEWAWENGIKNKIIRADKQLMNIQFDEHGDFKTYGFTGIDTTFTVEVEEEITEDIEFKCLIEKNITNEFHRLMYSTINEWKDESSKEFHAYIDGEFKCIWRDGKLVE